MTVHTSLYRKVLQDRQDLFNQSLVKGIYTPFVLPWDTLPVLFLALGVIVTPQLPAIAGRFCRVCLFVSTCIYMVSRWPYARTVGMTAGYGIGLAGFWGIIMTFILLILHDPGKDFKRIEVRRDHDSGPSLQSFQASGADSLKGESNGIRRRVTNKHEDADRHPSGSQNSDSEPKDRFVWQDYPADFLHRLDWSADLMTSFRGINWNFRVPIRTYVIPPPEGNPPELSQEARRRQKEALANLRRTAVFNFLYYYFVIDVLKTFMVTDPYWLGIAPLQSPTPWTWLASLEAVLPGAVHFVRLSVSLTATVSALTFIFSLSPLFFATALPYLMKDKLYAVTKSPLLEVWMYPPQWGSMFSTLCNRGLAGMWSTWWHQMFRYGISEPSRLLTYQLNIAPKSPFGRALQLFIAFGLTAGIHAVASSTTFSIVPSQPWHPFIFFFSQAVGILVQTEISRMLNKVMHFPRMVRQAGNFLFCFVFLWHVGPYLSDDFARCQIWLFEPVPVSFLRGIGFGPGDCWFPWLQFSDGGKWLGWWDGGSWYRSGIGIY